MTKLGQATTLPLTLPPLADSAPELRRWVGLGAESPENAGPPLQTGVAASGGWRLPPGSQGYHCPTARSGQGSGHLGFQFRSGRQSRVCFAWAVSNSTANIGILNCSLLRQRNLRRSGAALAGFCAVMIAGLTPHAFSNFSLSRLSILPVETMTELSLTRRLIGAKLA